MTAETAFLAALADRLAGAGLQPAPVLVGSALPLLAAELPALVLSLEALQRQGAGLGERAGLVAGALAVSASIDLANPVLPDEPALRLLSADRRSLVLPHGGWVKADGSSGALAAADLQVAVDGNARTLVNAAPAAAEVQPDAATGALLFGAPLPAAGSVLARYFVGQWERRVQPIAGVLQIDVRAASAAEVASLSAAVLDLLDTEAGRPAGLRKLLPLALGPVAAADVGLASSRGRSLRLQFAYEHRVDRPDSSGGVIRRVPLTTRLLATTVEPATGAFVTTVATESDP